MRLTPNCRRNLIVPKFGGPNVGSRATASAVVRHSIQFVLVLRSFAHSRARDSTQIARALIAPLQDWLRGRTRTSSCGNLKQLVLNNSAMKCIGSLGTGENTARAEGGKFTS